MKTYFGYIRVSTPKQGRGVSLDEQRSAITAFATREGLAITAWYVETETAAKQGRTEYTQMMRALEQGQATGVIIHKIDRGARNMKDWANLGELIDRGVDVQFVHESLDLRSRGGRLAADIQAVVAADYIRNLRDEVLKGFYGRLKQGVYPLPAPVGYLDQGAGIPKAVDPVMGSLVRYAFERYARGDIGLNGLSAELIERGLRAKRGAPLSRNGLAGMLHNPFYVGIIRIERRNESFQGAHTPLITQELFDRVQLVLAGKHAPKAKHHVFQYRGMVQHIGCTRRLTGEIVKDRFTYYRCHGPACHGISVSEPKLEAAVRAKLAQLTCLPDDLKDLRDIVEGQRTRRHEDYTKDEASLKVLHRKCRDRLARLTDAMIEGVLDRDMYEERKAGLLRERRQLEDRLNALGREPEWYEAYREFELRNTQLLRYERLTGDEKRNLVQAICSNFGVDGKKPVITLYSPYREIEKAAIGTFGGPRKLDVRTRAKKIFEILTSLPAPSNDNDDADISVTKSLKS